MLIDIDLYKKAGVRPSDVSRLLKISRVAASLWFNGHSQPHRLLVKRVNHLTAAVDHALAAGDLPLSDGVGRGDFHGEMAAVVGRHLQALSLGPIDE